MLKKILTLCAVVFMTAFSALSSRPAVKYDNWTIHPSFDNLPRRITDTEDKVYFFVHQRLFNKVKYCDSSLGLPMYAVPCGAVFTLDKNNPSAPMANINNLAPLSGADIVNFEVDPLSGVMVFTYFDGGVDVVSPDFKVYYFDSFKRRNFPGDSDVRNISFDHSTNSVRISAASGYIEVSTVSFRLLHAASWTKPVNDIISFGQSLAAIIDGTVCVTSADANPLRMNAFTPVPDVASRFSGIPMRLMPLSGNVLGVVTDSGQIAFLTLANGSWSFSEKVAADNSIRLAEDVAAFSPIEHTVIPSKYGFYVSTPNKGYIIRRASGNTSPSVTTIPLPGGSTHWSASYDGINYWFYRERGRFYSASYTGLNWSEFSVPYRPEAPLPGSECLYVHVPGQGLIASGERGGGTSSVGNPFNNKRYPALLSLYKDGKWKNIAPVYNLPAKCESDANLRNQINNNLSSWPVCEVAGLSADPLFPNYVHFGSTWGAIVSYDFTDTSQMPLLTTVPNYTFAGLGTKKLPQQSWHYIATATCAGIDYDGNLWYFANQHWNKSYPDKNHVALFYITPEGRREALETHDPNKLQWNSFFVDQGSNSNVYNHALVLKHPENKGKIIWFTESDNGASRYMTIYDTRQTPGDRSDDTSVHVRKYLLPNGGNPFFFFLNQALEDPVTGKVYLFNSQMTVTIDPNDRPIKDAFPAEILAINDADGRPMESYSPFECTRATFDEYGRLWLGTTYAGVIGLDPVSHNLVAHYDMDNSPLPSNKIRGIGWNPDTKSLFISSDLGMLEVRPDDVPSSGTPGSSAPSLSTSSVSHDFTGTVAIYNVPEAVNLTVTDKTGNIVATLSAPVKGVTYWDLISDSKVKAKPGLYIIRDNSLQSSFPGLTLTVK